MEKNYKYNVKEVADGIYLINEYLSTMYVIEGKDRALAIDCGTGVGDYKSCIESITKLPYDLVATHAHVDHIGGRGQFSDLYISAVDAKKIKSVTTAYRKFYTFTNYFTGNPFDKKSVNIKKITNEPKVHIIKEGDTFDLGVRVIEVIENPGHTCGSISLLSKTDRILFSGDVANSMLFMWMSNCVNIDTLIKTLDKLYNIDGYDIYFPSHEENSHPKSDMLKVIDAAKALDKKKNIIFPFVGFYKNNDVQIIYKTNRIH